MLNISDSLLPKEVVISASFKSFILVNKLFTRYDVRRTVGKERLKLTLEITTDD